MPPAVRSASHFVSTVTPTTSGTVPLPAGWQPGDVLLIVSVLAAATGTITAPPGYTEDVPGFHSAGTTSATMEVCHKVLAAGDAAPVVTCKGGRLVCTGLAVQGADPATPLDAAAAGDSNAGVSFPSVRAPSLTPATSGGLLITFHGEYEGTNGLGVSFIADPSETETDDQTSAVAGVSNVGAQSAYLALTGTAPTGTKTATAVTSSLLHGPMGAAVIIRAAATLGQITAATAGAATLTSPQAAASANRALTAATASLAAVTARTGGPA